MAEKTRGRGANRANRLVTKATEKLAEKGRDMPKGWSDTIRKVQQATWLATVDESETEQGSRTQQRRKRRLLDGI